MGDQAWVRSTHAASTRPYRPVRGSAVDDDALFGDRHGRGHEQQALNTRRPVPVRGRRSVSSRRRLACSGKASVGRAHIPGIIRVHHAEPLSRWTVENTLEYTDDDGIITSLHETASVRADKQGKLEHAFGGTTHWRYTLDFYASDGEALSRSRSSALLTLVSRLLLGLAEVTRRTVSSRRVRPFRRLARHRRTSIDPVRVPGARRRRGRTLRLPRLKLQYPSSGPTPAADPGLRTYRPGLRTRCRCRSSCGVSSRAEPVADRTVIVRDRSPSRLTVRAARVTRRTR